MSSFVIMCLRKDLRLMRYTYSHLVSLLTRSRPRAKSYKSVDVCKYTRFLAQQSAAPSTYTQHATPAIRASEPQNLWLWAGEEFGNVVCMFDN
jgi:hypothetical protein